MKYPTKNQICIIILMLTICSINTLGLGIASKYLENNILLVQQGEKVEHEITIQNSENTTIPIKISLTNEIAKIKGPNEIIIPANSYDTRIIIEISIPANSEIGEEYTINYEIEPITQGEGMIPMVVKMNQHFIVKVVSSGNQDEKQQSQNTRQNIKNKFTTIKETAIDTIKTSYDKTKTITQTTILIILFTTISIIIAAIIIITWKKSNRFAQKINNILEQTINKIKISNKKHAVELILKDNKKIKTLQELYESIYIMDEKTFTSHVHKYRNDFSWWIETSLQNPKLAKKLSKYTTKDHFIRILKKEI